jgi:hypothetical protein
VEGIAQALALGIFYADQRWTAVDAKGAGVHLQAVVPAGAVVEFRSFGLDCGPVLGRNGRRAPGT